MPFMVGFPSLSFYSTRDYNKAIHLVVFTSIGYYIFKKKNNLSIILFDILKYLGLAIMTIHIYLAFEKYRKLY